MKLTLIADYGVSDLAELEVRSKLDSLFPDLDYRYISVKPFNTIEAGFVLAQLVLNNNSSGIYYVNVAPRKDSLKERVDNDGEKLVAGEINGNLVVAVNSGFTLSYLREHTDFYEVDCDCAGSQFRSRDVFPAAVWQLATDLKQMRVFYPVTNSHCVGKKVYNTEAMPEDKVLYVDGYGNIKINNVLTESQMKADKLHVRIQGKSSVVYNRNGRGIFSVADGEMVLAEGSSGWYGCSGPMEERFLEISLRGGNAASQFGNVLPGTKVNIEEI